MDIFQGLNEQQRRAAETLDGPLMIIAGPGTGKTKTLIARLAHLLRQPGVQPQAVLALTFSRKAAEEIRRRLLTILPNDNLLPTVSTFHALGQTILSRAELARPIMDDATRQSVIAELARPAGLRRTSLRELGLLISTAKTTRGSQPESALRKLLTAYEQQLAERQVYDFDDLVVRAYHLLADREGPGLYQYVFVDEFQDTNELQYELTRQLCQTDAICVIGDPRQSIYGFRGADERLFERFSLDYPHARTITLDRNYRSSPQIVDVANHVFRQAPALSTEVETGTAQLVQTLNEYTEAAYIIRQIEAGIGGSDMLKAGEATQFQEPRSYAVLYRTRAAARALQQQFAASGLPYQIAGEGSPYERPVIQTLIAIMRQLPVSHTSEKTPLRPPLLKTISATELDQGISQLRVAMDVPDLIERICEVFGLRESLTHQELTQLCSVAVQFGAGQEGVVDFLAHLDRIAEQEFYDATLNVVTLMTIHSAKGLEFPCVFLCAAEEGILPKSQCRDVDEEQRLLYVAVTRAQRRLDILYTTQRNKQTSTLSRFVEVLPGSVLPRTVDPDMAAAKKRLERRRQIRAQSSLF